MINSQAQNTNSHKIATQTYLVVVDLKVDMRHYTIY